MDQAVKFRVRVVPSIVEYAARFGRAPAGLALSLAAHLHYTTPGVEVRAALADDARWGSNLRAVPELADAVMRGLEILTRMGPDAMLRTADISYE